MKKTPNNFIKNLPNIASMLNALCGLLALLISLYYRTHIAVYIACGLIVLGGIFDSVDGKLARKYDVASELGKQLDSFADLISFGIAPMGVFLGFHSMYSTDKYHPFVIMIGAFYMCCAIYRLARFNVTETKNYFEGLPTTASGVIIGIYIILSNVFLPNQSHNIIYTIISLVFIVILGCLMVSKITVKKL